MVWLARSCLGLRRRAPATTLSSLHLAAGGGALTVIALNRLDGNNDTYLPLVFCAGVEAGGERLPNPCLWAVLLCRAMWLERNGTVLGKRHVAVGKGAAGVF